MLILPQTVKINWARGNCTHFKNLGYTYTGIGQEFEVNVLDLKKGSSVYVKVLCDYCLEKDMQTIITKRYADYIIENERSNIHKDCCKSCTPLKFKESVAKTYGVEHVFQLEHVKNKSRQTNMDRYGFPSAIQNEKIRNKAKETHFERYGVEYQSQTENWKVKSKATSILKYGTEHPTQNQEVIDKRIDTNIRRYGVENNSQTDEWKEKIRNTSLEKWGVEYFIASDEVREKIAESFYKNGTIKTSSQQIDICQSLIDLGYDVQLNYPVSKTNLDVALFLDNGIKINIEYDGTFWHSNSAVKDRRRDEYLKENGWKIIRIKGRRKTPSIEDLVNSINTLMNTERLFIQIKCEDYHEEVV